jgi:hypothetical protein
MRHFRDARASRGCDFLSVPARGELGDDAISVCPGSGSGMFCSVAKDVSPPAAAEQVKVLAYLGERVTHAAGEVLG